MNPASEVTGGLAPTRGERSLEQAVGFALGHRFRVEILAALHEGPAGAPELAKALQQPRRSLRYHIDELLKDGAIEVAEVKRAGNLTTHLYRVTELAYFSEARWQELTSEERQITSALILEASWAEALASLWAGKFHSDPLVCVIWNRLLLDPQGRAELADEQARSWARIEEIEAEAAARRVITGDPGQTYVVSSLGFERSRNKPPAARPSEAGICLDAPAHSSSSVRSVEEAVSHSIGHRIRVEILAALHEGPATPSELARIVGQPLSLLDYHVHQLEQDGAIRVLRTKKIRNIEQPIYGYVTLPEYSDQEFQELTPQERQVISAISLRAAMAESLASLWAGKFHQDPRVMVAWNRILLDSTGRKEFADEQRRSWETICAIERQAGERLEDSGAAGQLYVVTLLGFERSRSAPPAPLSGT